MADETLAHILSKCPSTQSDRVGRHDAVCGFLAKRLRGIPIDGIPLSNRVEREKTYRLGEAGGTNGPPVTFRPDISVTMSDKIILYEVSVVYEAERGACDNTLKQIRRAKLHKYRQLQRALECRENKPVFIRPLIVGSRGGWIASNNKVLVDCGVKFTQHDRNCCVERAIRGSIITYRRFIFRTREPLIRDV